MQAQEEPRPIAQTCDIPDHVPLPHPKYKMTITTDPEKLQFLHRALGHAFSRPISSIPAGPIPRSAAGPFPSPAAKKLDRQRPQEELL